MENEIITNNEQQPIETFELEKFNELKNNSVPKEDFEKLQEKYKGLLNSYVKGEKLAAADTPSVEKDLNQLKKDFSKAQTSLDGWTAALALREELLSRGEDDPFLPVGKKIVHTEEDVATAARVVQGIQHCIDYAQGDPEIFATELQRITVDTAPPKRRK